MSDLLTDFTLVHTRDIKHDTTRRSIEDTRRVTLPFKGSEITLRLVPNTHLFAHNPRAIRIDAHNTHHEFLIDRHEFFVGNVLEYPLSSAVRVHIGSTGLITGEITIEGVLHMIEPIHRYLEDESAEGQMVIYTAQDMKWPHNAILGGVNATNATMHQSFCAHDSAVKKLNEIVESRRRRTSDSSTQGGDIHNRGRRGASSQLNTCQIAVVADYRYFADHGSNYAVTAAAMMSTVDFINSRFRLQNFDGLSNIGVAVAQVVIYESSATDPLYSATSWEVTSLLSSFSTLNWRNYCLAHLFTYQEFSGGVQGLAWVGNPHNSGICDGYGTAQSMYLNTGLTTGLNWGQRLLTLSFMLTAMHEVGHNFGSPHDPSDVSDPRYSTCSPLSGAGGRYVMYPIAVDGSEANNDDFSPCSRTFMKNIMDAKGDCFTPTPQGVCGNGVLEPSGADGVSGNADDEECDAGFQGDSCCTAGCKLKAGAVCSDVNKACCKNCQAAGPSVKCFSAFDNDLFCRADTYCQNGVYDCPTIGQKPAGTPCINEGSCVPDNVLANRCKSFCARFGAVKCKCEGDECHICCKNDASETPYCPSGYIYESRTHTNGTTASLCFSASVSGWTTGDTTYPGSRPFPSTCTAAYTILAQPEFSSLVNSQGDPYSDTNLILRAGTPCSKGQCSTTGTCQEQTDDFQSKFFGFINGISLSKIKNWIKKNIVGATMILSLLLYIPGSCYLHCKDKKKIKRLKKEAATIEEKAKQYDTVSRKKRKHTFQLRDDAPPPRDNMRVAPAPYQPSEQRQARLSNGWVGNEESYN